VVDRNARALVTNIARVELRTQNWLGANCPNFIPKESYMAVASEFTKLTLPCLETAWK